MSAVLLLFSAVDGIQEVRGSIPLISTRKSHADAWLFIF
jgi:hypothetical protein